MATHSLSAASETFIRGAFANARRDLAELPPAAEVWEALSDGLDEETLLDLARRAAAEHGVADDFPIILDPALGLALVGQDPARPALRLHWDGNRFSPLKDGEELRPSLHRLWELAALAELNTPEATWARIARGRSEAEMTELARQAVKTLPGGNHIRELNLEYESGSAVARTRAFALRQTPTLPPTHTRAFAWSEEADTFKKTEYWDRPSVLVTVETLRSVCADLY